MCASTRSGVRDLLDRAFGLLVLRRADGGLGEDARCFVSALGLERRKTLTIYNTRTILHPSKISVSNGQVWFTWAHVWLPLKVMTVSFSAPSPS